MITIDKIIMLRNQLEPHTGVCLKCNNLQKTMFNNARRAECEWCGELAVWSPNTLLQYAAELLDVFLKTEAGIFWEDPMEETSAELEDTNHYED